MTHEPETMDPALDIIAAFERFVASALRRSPVAGDGRLAGQTSWADVLNAMTEHWDGVSRDGFEMWLRAISR